MAFKFLEFQIWLSGKVFFARCFSTPLPLDLQPRRPFPDGIRARWTTLPYLVFLK